MNRQRIWWGGLLTILLLGLGVLLLTLTPGASAPASAVGPPPGGQVRYGCEGCPGEIGSWRKVQTYIERSGCFPNDASCWTTWMGTGPFALMQYGTTYYRMSGQPDPFSPMPPYGIIHDERQWCDTDGDGDIEPAAGTWYLNAFSRPSLVSVYDPLTGDWLIECNWRVDLTQLYWNFAENDQCLYEVCVEPPTVTPGGSGPTPTPKCEWEEEPLILTPEPVPTVTPLPIPQDGPSVRPLAFIRREAMRPVWYGTDPGTGYFVWLWQSFLHAKLTAEVSPPAAPGCTVSARVYRSYFLGSNGVQVCPDPLDGGPFEVAPGAPVQLPPEELGACRWRDVDNEEVHLLWTKDVVQPMPAASWDFFNVTPFQPNPFDVGVDYATIQYKVLVVTTYDCNGYVVDLVTPHDLSLNVGLVKPVRER